MEIKNIRRKLVQTKFFLVRAYGWISVPAMIMVVVGVITPYIHTYFDINILWIIAFSLLSLLVFGLMDYFLGLSKAELSFEQEQNILELSYIERIPIIEKKLDKLIKQNGINGRNKT